MPTILETIAEYEPDLLMMIAENWGIDLEIDQKNNIAEQVAHLILGSNDIEELTGYLPENIAAAIDKIIIKGGKINWEQFTREFGEFREMGAAKREKERPHQTPHSVSEYLYYRGLIGRGFFESVHGLREFAFMPDEFIRLIKSNKFNQENSSISSISDKKIINIQHCEDRLLDHACTFLALARMGKSPKAQQFQNPSIDGDFLLKILSETDFFDNGQIAKPELLKKFLEAQRAESFSLIVKLWMESSSINELDYLKDVECEGGWKNYPAKNRLELLNWIDELSNRQWYLTNDLVAWVQKNHPDFIRTGGEYESWIIRNSKSGDYLRGIENWDQVEGNYLRFMINGPLFWMGILKTGFSVHNHHCFRKTDWAESLIKHKKVLYKANLKTNFVLEKAGRITVDRLFPLHIRYLLARFCEFINHRGDHYVYHITPSSLQFAQDQGLKISQISNLLKKFGSKPLPPNLLEALEGWEKNHIEAKFKYTVLLTVHSPDIISDLMKSPHRRYVLEQNNPTCVVITQKGIPYIRAWLMELGIFSEVTIEK